MNFNFDEALKAKETGKFLSFGIKNATFKGVAYGQQTTQSGEDLAYMALKFDIDDYGDYEAKIFEPRSNERQEMSWGLTPSPLDHFLIVVREVLEAVAPNELDELNSGKKKLSGSFKQVVTMVASMTTPGIGTKTQIKLIPNNKGYANLPAFPARLTKDGQLGISTRIIGKDLTLTARELKQIETAQAAKPTQMSTSTTTDTVNSMLDDLNGSDSSSDSDLPF